MAFRPQAYDQNWIADRDLALSRAESPEEIERFRDFERNCFLADTGLSVANDEIPPEEREETRAAQEREKQKINDALDDLQDELAETSSGTEPHKPAVEVGEDDDYGAPERIKRPYVCRYDRALGRRREAEANWEALPDDALPVLRSARKYQLDQACKRVMQESKAAATPEGRRRDAIDEWRAGEGRLERNAQERARYQEKVQRVEGRPVQRRGADKKLSNMSEGEKAAHKRRQARARKQRQRVGQRARGASLGESS